MPNYRFSAAIILAVTAFAAAPAARAEDDNAGQMAFNNACRTCHSVGAGDNRLGPRLNDIVGRKAGTVDGFAYSATLKDSSIVWDEATLGKFIADPASVAPGSNMKPFTGISDPEQIAER